MSPPAQDLRLLSPALACWVGAALTPGPGWWVVVVAGVVLVRWRTALLAAVVVCAAGGVLVAGLRVQARQAGPLPAWAAAGRTVSATLVVTDDPRAVVSRKGNRLTLTLTRLERADGLRERVPVLVLAQGGGWAGLLPSTRIAVHGRLAAAQPGDDVAALLFPDRALPRVLSGPSPVQRLAGRLRGGLRRAAAGLPWGSAGLLPGLVDGDTGGLSQADRASFRATGLTHLVAVSGTNCTAVLAAVLGLARGVGWGRRRSAVVSGVALLLFVVVARPSASVLRAAVMGWMSLAAWVGGRRRGAVATLSGAVLVLVLVDPSLARSAGFALSVLASGGLLLVAPGWRAALVARGWSPGAAEALAIPAAAQVACTPVIAAIGGGVSVVAVPANLLAAVAVAPATLAGVLTAVVAPVWPGLAQGVAWVAAVPCVWLLAVARVGARVPGATVGWPSGWWGAVTAALLAPVGLWLGRRLGRWRGRAGGR